MKKDIKFRGKRVDNGEWEHGFYCFIGYTDKEKAYIIPTFASAFYGFEVDSSTVGQCTGLNDKNGNEIYEGDIISLITEDGEPITIECKFGNVRRQIYENLVEITGFYFERSNDGRKTFPIVNNYLHKHDTGIWEVVGNIHSPSVT